MAEPALAIRSLSVDRGARRVLSDATFDVRAGELVALLGPNGAGKSTLVRAALGLLPSVGEILYAGVGLASLDSAARARAAAYVPQRSALTAPLRVREVVAGGRFGRPPIGTADAVRRALDTARASSLADRRFVELSLGEQRRVLFARALATDAPVLLLDEPTASLDLRFARETADLPRELAIGGKALLVVMHDLNEARRIADRIIVLHEGRVVADGPPDRALDAMTLASVYSVVARPRTETGYEVVG